MKKQRNKLTLTVVSAQKRSAEMVRIWFSVSSGTQVEHRQEGDYFKLLFDAATEKPIMRTYTLSRVNKESGQLAIDFVIHSGDTKAPNPTQGGYGNHFAQTAKPGDAIEAIGPNNKKSILPDYRKTLFVADATAIPALEAVLRNDSTRGDIICFQCSQALSDKLARYGLPVLAANSKDELVDLLQSSASKHYYEVWCAGEYQMMRTTREHVKGTTDLPKDSQYFSSYWKNGLTEDGHKTFKQAIS